MGIINASPEFIESSSISLTREFIYVSPEFLGSVFENKCIIYFKRSRNFELIDLDVYKSFFLVCQ